MALGSTLAVLRPLPRTRFRVPIVRVEKPLLTPRQIEICPLLATGMPFKGIAHAMGMSEHTAKVYGTDIYRRLGLANRLEFVRWYWTEGQGLA